MKFPSVGAAGVLSLCLLSSPAFANSAGMIRNSGKQGASATCTACHSGAASTPTVEFSGPSSLAAGATGEYTFIIKGGAGVRGGLNVALDSASASLTAGSDTQVQSGELTHKAPKAFSGGEVRFTFSVVAPSSGGTLKLFGAGNSVNGNGDVTGDSSARTTLDVTITGGSTGGGGEEEEKGGCSATGGAPGLLLALAASMTALRRRS